MPGVLLFLNNGRARALCACSRLMGRGAVLAVGSWVGGGGRNGSLTYYLFFFLPLSID